MSAERMAMEEYGWALSQARIAHGEVKKWIVYAGEQLEIAGFPKDKISAKLRNDLPDFSPDYISQICGQMGWTDRRFSPEVEQTQPENSSTFPEQQDGAAEEPDMARCEKENQPYIDHLQKKIEFLQEVQKKLCTRPFLSLLDKKQYDEYILLADRAEKLAREAWDARQTVQTSTQFYLAQIVAISTIKHGASEYVSKVKELFSLTSKQVTKTLKGVVRDVHFLYEPTNVAQTVSKKTATPSIRGAVQRVGYSQIEGAPFALVDVINEAMVMAAIDDEATDLLSTAYDAVSPTNWVRADTGAAITSDDVANLMFKREGLLAAKRLIAQQGYDVSPGNLVLFVHPKAYQELLLDSNLNNFYQYARPEITATGLLEQLYGVDIVIADQVKAQDNTTNDTYRNVLAVKGVAFGMASARNVAMEAQRRNELQQVILSGTHRVKSVVIEETASCRISSAQ